MIVDPSAKPIPMTAELVDEGYHPVVKLTLPAMDWPAHIRWRGRIFAIYHETVAFMAGSVPSEKRHQLYREIPIYDAV